jgi:hypothetical protein
MNFDPTTVVPDYPSAEAEKTLDLEKWDVVPMKPPPMPAAASSGGGLAIAAGFVGLAVLVTVVVAAKRRGKR